MKGKKKKEKNLEAYRTPYTQLVTSKYYFPQKEPGLLRKWLIAGQNTRSRTEEAFGMF